MQLLSGVSGGYITAPDGRLLATGYLDLSTGSIEAVFTLPQYTGKGLGSQIIEAIKSEARGRGFEQLTLSSTPNAQTFYEKHGFKLMQESMYPSALAQAELRCMEMSINLLG
ncbi:GNAT family N-acetyltransferase [Klebsiella pneumoniae]|uniref:GNAT family N-acetyltransferase n=2 Tax=Klebsiella pneumoniae TaxID=573 RepID=UPI0035CF71F1